MNTPRKSHRREFLTGKSAVDAVHDTLDAIQTDTTAETGWQPNAVPPTYLLRLGRWAMACQWEVLQNAGQHAQATRAAVEALDLVEELEAQLTIYRPESELSELNRTAFSEPYLIGKPLFELLSRCAALHRETAGAFDITTGPLIKAWGFFERQGRIPAPADLQTARDAVGSQWLEFNATEQTIRFLRPGMEINLGAVGKGYAADRAAEVMQAAGVRDFLIHGGQSSVLARGTRWEGTVTQPGWKVALGHPLHAGQQLAEVTLCDRALATSGSGTQFFRHGGKRFGHLLDPRSGRPAEQVLMVTVTAPTGELADALATAFYVLGPAETARYCQAHQDVAALIVHRGNGTAVTHQQWNFAADALRWLIPGAS